MESTLFIAVQSPTLEHTKKLLWMLGDDAPVFEEEVAPEWHELFNALEELTPPDDVLNIQDDTVLMNWTCGYWDDAFNDHSSSLNKAGFTRQAAYYWADEDEGYLLVDDSHYKKAAPKPTSQSQAMAATVSNNWSKEDKKIIANLLSLLDVATE